MLLNDALASQPIELHRGFAVWSAGEVGEVMTEKSNVHSSIQTTFEKFNYWFLMKRAATVAVVSGWKSMKIVCKTSICAFTTSTD